MKKTVLICVMMVAGIAEAAPWGRDASLADFRAPQEEAKETPRKLPGVLNHTTDALIYFHQTVVSEADGPRSHFYPSSSEYTRQAIHAHGFARGFILGCDRLMRENSDTWVYRKVITETGCLKLDPIPG